MLLAYLDEIGSPGAFVHPTHPRYADSPAFGYGGLVLEQSAVREFGAYFAHLKSTYFRSEIPDNIDSGRWEKKGANLLYARVRDERTMNLRALGSVLKKIRELEGHLFFYADEKPRGTPKETSTGSSEIAQREQSAMSETLNRLARHADRQDKSILILMDQINEKSRKQRLPQMYAHIFGRSKEHPEMRRILEPPMHIDSELSSNIQAADWICALIKRAIDYQLIEDSRYNWLPESPEVQEAKGIFTFESKVHLYQRSIQDIHNAQILYGARPVLDAPETGPLSDANRKKLELVRRAAERKH